jgi:predicted MFS family arabinose efflux permease
MLLGYLFCFGSIKESAVKSAKTSLDWRGALILAIAMSSIVLSLIRSATTGWGDSITLTLLGLGIVASIVLVMVERQQEEPLIDVKDFSKPLFFAGSALGFLSGVLSAVTLFFDPLYLQIIREQSPQLSGMVLFAIPVTGVLVALLIGWFIRRFGAINTIIIGVLAGILGALLHAGFTATSSLVFVIVAFVCLGIMWAMGNTVAIIAAQMAVGPARAGIATATNVTMFSVGGSVGLAIAMVIYHAVGMGAVQNTANSELLSQLISNPADFLQMQTSALTQQLFSAGFMQGFAAVMWFLLITAGAILLSILIGKMTSKREKMYVSQ